LVGKVVIVFRKGQLVQFVIFKGLSIFRSDLEDVLSVDSKDCIVPQSVTHLFQEKVRRMGHPFEGSEFHDKGSRSCSLTPVLPWHDNSKLDKMRACAESMMKRFLQARLGEIKAPSRWKK
jgi:hypothetical protein